MVIIIQVEVCKKEHGVEQTIHGCMKDKKRIFPGPGCSNIYGICPIFAEFYKKK